MTKSQRATYLLLVPPIGEHPAGVDLSGLRDNWNTFGEKDPMWAVLAQADRKGRRWSADEFFATGRDEIASVMRMADELGFPRRHRSVLDFGCGVGRLTRPLSEYFDEAVGVDIAPSMLAEAERHNDRPNCRFVHNESPDLAMFPDETFDLVYSNIVLQHVPPTLAKGYIAEFARILSSGGLVVFSLPTGPSDTLRGQLYRLLPDTLINTFKRRRDGATMAMNAVPMEEIVPLLTRIGMRVERADPDVDPGPGPNWRGFRYVASKHER
jgi:ubiquinone/menaquinone biosynthesis C-methylase UbiE